MAKPSRPKLLKPMTLGEYLKAQDIGVAEFAAKIGVHRSQIYRLLSGQRGVNVDVVAAIETATGGAVTAQGLVRRSA